MRLVSIGIRLGFAEEKGVPTPAQKVFKAITGKIPSESSPRYGEGFVVRATKRKLTVMWNPHWCSIALENVSDVNKGIETILTTLEQVDTAVPICKLSERRVTTYWILPAPDYDFPSLERKYREKMLTQNEISSCATDSSTVFDIRIGELTLHHQSGTMWPQQLSDDYLKFKADDIPKAFLFLEASIVENKVVEYSRQELQNHLPRAFDYCKSHSDAFRKIWEGIL